MKITREIMNNSIEIELTGVELERCFNEYQATHDRNELVHQLKDAEYENIDGIPEDLMDEMAEYFRELMNDKIDEYAIKVIQYFEDRLKPYKEVWKVFRKKVTVTAEKEYTIKAKSAEEADAIFETFGERKLSQIASDICEDVEYDGEWYWDDAAEEDENTDPEDADISEEDVR